MRLYLENYNKYKFDGIFACFLGKYLNMEGPVIVYTTTIMSLFTQHEDCCVILFCLYIILYIIISIKRLLVILLPLEE